MSNLKFTEIDKAVREKKGVVSLATRPNRPAQYGEGSLSAEALKQRFDDLALAVIEKYNELVAIMGGKTILEYFQLPAEIKVDNISGQTLAALLKKIITNDGKVRATDPTGTANISPDLDSVLAALYASFSEVESNEEERKAYENQRRKDENTRESNEDTRESNEETRKSNEDTRESNEDTRESNEETRKSNEDTRESNEETRKSNELTRKSVGIKDSAYPDGSGAADEWSSGKNYIGVAMSHDAPSISEYKWCLFKGEKGDKGDKGDPLYIVKTYRSVEAMHEDFDNTSVALGNLVAIDTGNVEDPDNAKLFLKTVHGFQFITDLSGTEGIQGPQGDKGDKGDPGDIGIIPYAVQEQILWILGTNGTHGLKYWAEDDYARCGGIGECEGGNIEIGSMFNGKPVTEIYTVWNAYGTEGGFIDNLDITGVIIPDSITKIYDSAFRGCKNIAGDVTIPASVTEFGDYVFSDCEKITSAHIYCSLDGGSAQFMRCPSLTDAVIGEGSTVLDYTFSNCTSLARVTIPKSVTQIKSAFFDCPSLTDVYYAGSEEEWSAIQIDSRGSSALKNATKHYNYGG